MPVPVVEARLGRVADRRVPPGASVSPLIHPSSHRPGQLVVEEDDERVFGISDNDGLHRVPQAISRAVRGRGRSPEERDFIPSCDNCPFHIQVVLGSGEGSFDDRRRLVQVSLLRGLAVVDSSSIPCVHVGPKGSDQRDLE